MPMVDTIPLETLAQSPLRSLIDKVRDQKIPDPLFFQIFAHVPGYTEALFDALHRSHMEGNVDHKLKEIPYPFSSFSRRSIFFQFAF